MGEDHDAAYRGFAYYGFKGILDNSFRNERNPNSHCGVWHDTWSLVGLLPHAARIKSLQHHDDDSKKQGVLQMQMASYQALSLTTVVPCYMANEEEILPAVLDFQ